MWVLMVGCAEGAETRGSLERQITDYIQCKTYSVEEQADRRVSEVRLWEAELILAWEHAASLESVLRTHPISALFSVFLF